MQSIKLSLSFLVALCFLMIGCGPAKSSNQSAGVNTQGAAGAQESLPAWRAIYFDWVATDSEIGDSCARGRVTLNIDSTLKIEDCGEVRAEKINQAELVEFERRFETVLDSISKPITCSGIAIADYSQSWKLIDQNGQAIQVYKFDIEDTCGRVANVDELNNYLYDLREKYFPRLEEGQYQD